MILLCIGSILGLSVCLSVCIYVCLSVCLLLCSQKHSAAKVQYEYTDVVFICCYISDILAVWLIQEVGTNMKFAGNSLN